MSRESAGGGVGRCRQQAEGSFVGKRRRRSLRWSPLSKMA